MRGQHAGIVGDRPDDEDVSVFWDNALDMPV